MKIKINGMDYTHSEPDCSLYCVLSKYLSMDNVETVRGVAVALNGELVRKADWKNIQVGEEDELEVLTATQGG